MGCVTSLAEAALVVLALDRDWPPSGLSSTTIQAILHTAETALHASASASIAVPHRSLAPVPVRPHGSNPAFGYVFV